MRALVYRGPKNVAVEDVPDARIERPTDALVKVIATNICGSDLHMYEGRTDVEQGVRDHERHDPSPPTEQPAEQQPHREVADEPAEALVEVVAAADECARHDDGDHDRTACSGAARLRAFFSPRDEI